MLGIFLEVPIGALNPPYPQNLSSELVLRNLYSEILLLKQPGHRLLIVHAVCRFIRSVWMLLFRGCCYEMATVTVGIGNPRTEPCVSFTIVPDLAKSTLGTRVPGTRIFRTDDRGFSGGDVGSGWGRQC